MKIYRALLRITSLGMVAGCEQQGDVTNGAASRTAIAVTATGAVCAARYPTPPGTRCNAFRAVYFC